MNNIINLKKEINKITLPWQPGELCRTNNQIIRLAYMKGEYHWHKHDNEDELFQVIQGVLTIQIKNQPDIILNEHEIFVVPKGTEHCPKSLSGAYVLMFEPLTLK